MPEPWYSACMSKYFINRSASLAKCYRVCKGAFQPEYWSNIDRRWIPSTTFPTVSALLNGNYDEKDVHKATPTQVKKLGAVL